MHGDVFISFQGTLHKSSEPLKILAFCPKHPKVTDSSPVIFIQLAARQQMVTVSWGLDSLERPTTVKFTLFNKAMNIPRIYFFFWKEHFFQVGEVGTLGRFP